MPTPHNALFRAVFQDPEEAAGLMRGLLPQLAHRIGPEVVDIRNADTDDGDVGERRGDLLCRLRLGEPDLDVSALVEHERKGRRDMPFRFLEKTFRSWGDSPDKVPLVPVLPVLIYNGRRPWSGPLTLSGLYGPGAGLLGDLGSHLLDLRVLLVDLRRTPDEGLPAEGVGRMALLALKWVDRPGLLPRLLRERETLRRVGDQGRGRKVVPLLNYVLRTRPEPSDPQDLKALADLVGPEPVREVMGWIDKVEREAYGSGREAGREEGREAGREEGRLDGRRLSLARVATRLFGALPPEVEAAIQQADPALLDRVEARLFTAGQPGELLD